MSQNSTANQSDKDLDEIFESHSESQFKPANNSQEILNQISVISNLIGRCEQMLQHLAIGNIPEEIDTYMLRHVQLTAKKNELTKKLEEIRNKKTEA